MYQEENGLFFFDRRPKFDLSRLRAAQMRPAAVETTGQPATPTASLATIPQAGPPLEEDATPPDAWQSFERRAREAFGSGGK